MPIEAVHGAHAPPAQAGGDGQAHDHHYGHHHHGHHHPHSPAASLPESFGLAGQASPLWWSAPQRLACAAALATGLWLVIIWAVR